MVADAMPAVSILDLDSGRSATRARGRNWAPPVHLDRGNDCGDDAQFTTVTMSKIYETHGDEMHFDSCAGGDTMIAAHPSPGSESATRCAGCGTDIRDRYYFQVDDRNWHCECLRCAHCATLLAPESSCFARDGQIFCKQDYYRLFSAPWHECGRCRLTITPDQLVMKVRPGLIFHVDCFSCATCGTGLRKGDFFGLDTMGDAVLCRQHYLERAAWSTTMVDSGASVAISGSPAATVKRPAKSNKKNKKHQQQPSCSTSPGSTSSLADNLASVVKSGAWMRVDASCDNSGRSSENVVLTIDLIAIRNRGQVCARKLRCVCTLLYTLGAVQ